MKTIKDFTWKPGIKVEELVDNFATLGYQSIELNNASELALKMKKESCKIYLTFTSNMVTTGLRGFFAQLIKLKIVDVIVTTSASIEEDIIKSFGGEVGITSFSADDIAMHEKGENRIGNLFIRNESYMQFEDKMQNFLKEIYKKKKRIEVSELLRELGLMIKDENSILHQAALNNIPIFCPGIADSAIGFHLHMFQEKHNDFIVDVIGDVKNIILSSNHDEKKALISLGGSISKHYAIFSGLLNGGFDYAIYLTTSHSSSGSVSGATTKEAMSWGKLKDNASGVTVIGDVTITFPLMMINTLEKLKKQGLLKNL